MPRPKHQPLIHMLTIVNKTIQKAIFDPGANISIINHSLTIQLNLKLIHNLNDNLSYKTIANTSNCLGLVTIYITIGN